MTNPGPLSGDERPLTGPDDDLLAAREVPPPAQPPAPAYEPTELLEPTPAYDSVAREVTLGEPGYPEPGTPGQDADYQLAPNPAGSGPLVAVKAFAAQRPAMFLAAALLAGWLVGKLLPSSGDDD